MKKSPFFAPVVIFSLFFFSLGVIGAVKITAQEMTSPPPPCIYNCIRWGDCQPGGYQYCKEVQKLPSGCREANVPPQLTLACTYNIINHPICQYTCSQWGPCRADGTMECVNATASNPNCSGGEPPSPISCSYSPPSCEYTYSNWSICDSTGNQYRQVKSASPPGCSGTPVTSRDCTFVNNSENATSTGSSIDSTSTSSSTPTTNVSSSNLPCVYSCSAWSACRTEGYKTRTCSIPSAKGCLQKEEKTNCAPLSSTPITDTISPQSCSILCADWGTCTPTGLQFQKCWPTPYGCPGEAFQNEKKCTPVLCQFDYSPWSQCVDGWQFRFVNSVTPSGCVGGEKKLKQECLAREKDAKQENLPIEIQSEVLIDPDFSVDEEWKRNNFETEKCPDAYCGGLADPDGDYLSNNDESRYKTNPLNRDSDGDGKIDGEEVSAGTNPLKSSASGEKDKIDFEDVRDSGKISAAIYEVRDVKMLDLKNGEKGISISGRGPAESYLVIYLYSELPTILTVKTDSNGNWSYILEEQIEDGKHKVYVAVTDSEGKVKSKSNPLFFVKTAKAVTLYDAAEKSRLPENKIQSRPGISLENILFILVLSFFAFVSGLIIIGVIIKKIASKVKMN